MYNRILKLFYVVIYCCAFVLSIASCRYKENIFSRDEIKLIQIPFQMPKLQKPIFPDKKFNIEMFGTIKDSTTKNTYAIQRAIDSAAKVGGGIIIIPKGTWLTGAIRLENNINLHLEEGAVLLFSQDFRDYLPVVFSRHEDIECYKYSAFIYANNKKNIAITGKGILNGQGKPWWELKRTKKDAEDLLNEMARKNIPVDERIFDGANGRELRPAFFQPIYCKDILVEGVTFLYGAFWTITPTYCENVIIRNVHIITEGPYGHTPNGDGVNPSSSKNVLIEECEFDTGDDCIAIKAGRDEDGLRVNKPSENIIIRNCRGFNGHGGIVIGSETSGGIRNVYAVNCKFNGTDRIVRIKSARGRGGIIENLWFEDLVGENIMMEAIHINMLYTGERFPEQIFSNETPQVRNVHYKNIKCVSGKSYTVELIGLPEMPVKKIFFMNVDMSASKGINFCDVNEIIIQNSKFNSFESPTLSITDCKQIRFDTVNFSGNSNWIINVNGQKSNSIIFNKTNIDQNSSNINIEPSLRKDVIFFKD